MASNFKSVWFFRGRFNIKYKLIKSSNVENIFEDIDAHLSKEMSQEMYLFVSNFRGKILGNYFTPNANKIKSLKLAREIGLSIPNTKIISNKKELQKMFLNTKSTLITKGIQDSASFGYLNKKNEYINFTNFSELTKEEDLKKIPDLFFHTQLQDYIEKKYELRIFFIDNKIFSLSIFSQRNEKTQVDFRHYDKENENKLVPFKLPIDIEGKIKRLMKGMELNCGSIDMIVNKNNEYVFLEINPVGLFEVVDYYGGYSIYREIANFLS